MLELADDEAEATRVARKLAQNRPPRHRERRKIGRRRDHPSRRHSLSACRVEIEAVPTRAGGCLASDRWQRRAPQIRSAALPRLRAPGSARKGGGLTAMHNSFRLVSQQNPVKLSLGHDVGTIMDDILETVIFWMAVIWGPGLLLGALLLIPGRKS